VVFIACSSRSAPRGLYHNTAVIIDADGSLLGIYRKITSRTIRSLQKF